MGSGIVEWSAARSGMRVTGTYLAFAKPRAVPVDCARPDDNHIDLDIRIERERLTILGHTGRGAGLGGDRSRLVTTQGNHVSSRYQQEWAASAF